MNALFKYAIVLSLGLAVGFIVKGPLNLEDVAKFKWLDEITVILNKALVSAKPAADVVPIDRRLQRVSTRSLTIGLPNGSGRSRDGARSSPPMGAVPMPNPPGWRPRFSPGNLPPRPLRRTRMALRRTRKLRTRSCLRSRLPRGRRSRLLRLTKSANVTGTVWNGCAAAPRATRLRASRTNWAARSWDPSSWVSWGTWATRPPRRPPRRPRMARRRMRKLGPRIKQTPSLR